MVSHRNTDSRSTRRRGLALIDVVVGTVMLAVGLAVVISSASRSRSWQTRGENQMIAAWLVDEYLATALVDGPEEFQKKYIMEGPCDYPHDEFRYRMDIEYQGPQQTFIVTARVSWLTPSGWRDVTAQTHLAPRLNDEETIREPEEPIDRWARYYPEEQDE